MASSAQVTHGTIRATLGQAQVEARVPCQRGLQLTGQLQLLDRELAERLEHREARFADVDRAVEQALREQRLDAGPGLLERLVRDLGGSIGGEPGNEGGKAPEEALLVGREQLVAPGDRRPQRLVSADGVARAGVQ